MAVPPSIQFLAMGLQNVGGNAAAQQPADAAFTQAVQAVPGGGGGVAGVLAAVNALSATVQANHLATQQQLQAMQTRLARIDNDMLARIVNANALEGDHSLMPLTDVQGNALPVGNGLNDFPATRGGMLGLSAARVASLFNSMGLPPPPPGATLAARRALLARHCGLRAIN